MIVKAIPDSNNFPNGGTCPRRQDFIGSDQRTVNIRHHQAYIFLRSFFVCHRIHLHEQNAAREKLRTH